VGRECKGTRKNPRSLRRRTRLEPGEPLVPPVTPSSCALVAGADVRSAGSVVPAPRAGCLPTTSGLDGFALLRGRWWPTAIPARWSASA
jgi:hypothetical protein